jgi:hypothetical protein
MAFFGYCRKYVLTGVSGPQQRKHLADSRFDFPIKRYVTSADAATLHIGTQLLQPRGSLRWLSCYFRPLFNPLTVRLLATTSAAPKLIGSGQYAVVNANCHATDFPIYSADVATSSFGRDGTVRRWRIRQWVRPLQNRERASEKYPTVSSRKKWPPADRYRTTPAERCQCPVRSLTIDAATAWRYERRSVFSFLAMLNKRRSISGRSDIPDIPDILTGKPLILLLIPMSGF